jgi:hypothetical protein
MQLCSAPSMDDVSATVVVGSNRDPSSRGCRSSTSFATTSSARRGIGSVCGIGDHPIPIHESTVPCAAVRANVMTEFADLSGR